MKVITFRGSGLPSATGTSGCPAISHYPLHIKKTNLIKNMLKVKNINHYQNLSTLMESAGTGTHTRSKALRVASSVVTLPNIVVKPKISNSGV